MRRIIKKLFIGLIIFTVLFHAINYFIKQNNDRKQAVELCSAKNDRPDNRIDFETINVAGHWLQIPKENLGKMIRYRNNYTDCFSRVYLEFDQKRILGSVVSPVSRIGIYLTGGQRTIPISLATDAAYEAKYIEEFDLTFFRKKTMKDSIHLEGVLDNFNSTILPERAVFRCYKDPKRTKYPNCSTFYKLNSGLYFDLRMDSELLKHWKEIYIYIFSILDKSLNDNRKERL